METCEDTFILSVHVYVYGDDNILGFSTSQHWRKDLIYCKVAADVNGQRSSVWTDSRTGTSYLMNQQATEPLVNLCLHSPLYISVVL